MKDMLGRGEALSAGDALELVLSNTPGTHPEKETIPIDESFGRVLAVDLISPEDLPGFARSTMDGYAVRASDTFGAVETSPSYLKLAGEVPMGAAPALIVGTGEAARIATGGMLPEGADSVLMLEHAQLAGEVLEAQNALAPGENVIQRGEDIREGEVLLRMGRRLGPQDAAAMAALGILRVEVYRRPRISIISTGDELVPPAEPAGPGIVRDSNSYALMGMAAEEGCEPVFRGILRDDPGSLRAELERSAGTGDAVLVSGGSSVGSRDLVEGALRELGSVVFHSVSIKPGKPLLFGLVEGCPVFGLPGHPRAVKVCFDLFVRPALRRISGASDTSVECLERIVRARLSRSIHSPAGRHDIVPVRLEKKDDGLLAVPLLGRSGLITSIVNAQGSVHIPVGSPGHEKGEEVDVLLD